MLQTLAVAAAILKMRKCAILLRPFLSSTSFKNTGNYKHSGHSPFLCWSTIMEFSSKTTLILGILGIPLFDGRGLIFIIFTTLQEIIKCWYVHRFVLFGSISKLLYFQLKTTHFATFTDWSFLIIFHFCYTSLLIFKISMLICEHLNISKDQ